MLEGRFVLIVAIFKSNPIEEVAKLQNLVLVSGNIYLILLMCSVPNIHCLPVIACKLPFSRVEEVILFSEKNEDLFVVHDELGSFVRFFCHCHA